jgi:hypothetical protein
MEQVLSAQIPQLPVNTQFGRVVINLTSELAIVSPTIMLTSNVSPLWREPRAVILGLPPTRRIQNGTGIISEPQDVEVHATMTTVISLESTLIHIPFLMTDNITILVEIHQRLRSFRLSIDLRPLGMLQGPSYRVVMNPSAPITPIPNQHLLNRTHTRRREFSGRFSPTSTTNLSSMRILVWNCRGAGNPNFCRNFADLLRSHRPSIAVLVETRISGQRAEDISSMLGFNRVCRSEAVGFRGGIWLLWNSGEVSLDVLMVTDQAIHASVQVSPSKPHWLLSAVYASPHLDTRLNFWDQLANFASTHNAHWVVAGDFNDILSSHEKFSSSPANPKRISAFHNCLNTCNLLDLGFNGPRFTWTNKRDRGLVMERLDRFFCNPSWQQLFEESTVLHLPRVHSDHTPILLDTEPAQHHFGDRPFRFETIWLTDPSFPKLVHESWQTFPNNVNLALADFTTRVTSWNKQEFGNIFYRKRRLLARINGVQKALARHPSDSLLKLETDLSNQFQSVLRMEEEFWALKSRMEWSLLGDRNTSFFHTSVLCRRHWNKIWCLKDSMGNWSQSTTQLKTLIRDYFVTLYSTECTSSDLCNSLVPNGVSFSEEIKAILDVDVSKQEIVAAFKSFKPYKAPGPDGFHPVFFQKFWHIVGDSTTKYLEDIFQKRTIPPKLNETLVCLIPKVGKPELIQQFRPIGLCNTIYKAITKVLVNRLKPYLSDVVHPLQASFVPGRKASDNVILVQEIIHSMSISRSKIGNMAIKIDLEKAYDRLEWNFIRLTLKYFNLPQWWIDLIMSCISSSHLSILVNGEKTDSFAPSRGIRQGDPLSPYIFILCMEYLAWLIQGEVTNGSWKGIKVSRQGPTFSHIFFADNLVLFAKATKANCRTINKVLNTFCQASGQKINNSKSCIYMPATTSPSNIAMVKSELGIKVSNNFGKYLGVPIITDARDKKAFEFIIEKVRDKLAGWKAKTLSMAGRCTLINSVSSAIPTHVMQCCLLPSKTCAELDKLNRSFLWGDSSAKKKLHLIKWDSVSRPKEEGGLGIKRSRCRNKALLAKRLWDFRLGSVENWAVALRNKYSPTRSRVCRKSISWKSLQQATPICDKGMGHLIQNGRTIKFWTDNWQNLGPIRNLISGPLLQHEESLLLNECWDPNGAWCFDKLSVSLLPSITNTILAVPRPFLSPLEDGICWQPSSNGSFDSKSAYKIALNLEQAPPSAGCWKWIWKLNTLPRIIFFIWQLCHERLPTKVLLSHRKIIQDNLCHLCQTNPESCMHLLRDCPSIIPLWYSMGFTSTSHFFTQSSVCAWVKYWAQDKNSPSQFPQFQWKDIFPVLIWTIWTARNKWVMEKIPFDINLILRRTKTITTELWFNLPQKGPRSNSETILVYWRPPPTDFFKLNTDGSAEGNPGLAGAGGIIRNHTGGWIKGFSRKIGVTNSLAAELWGLRDGLILAHQQNIKKIIIELDAKAVIDLVQPANLIPLSHHPYRALIVDCRSLI